jgi:hypothetical protein
MVVNIPNPYTGKDDETCSVSFAAQQKLAETGISGQQTESDYNRSKMLGEWGVITAKLKAGQIPDGTKVLAFTNPTGQRGYAYVKGGKLFYKVYSQSDNILLHESDGPQVGEGYIKSEKWSASIPQSVTLKEKAQVAAPTPSPAVNPGSASVGSMADVDVAAMFVKIKDDLAKEQGLNIKGANADLDVLVYKAIGERTGYTGAEVKAKIDAYKAAGNKLSALKKKVMAGTYKVPEGKNTGSNPQDTKATPAAPLTSPQVGPKKDPQPNAVPTVATPKLANEIKKEVQAEAKANPGKVYTDEDVAAQYIMAKDQVVADSNGKWTLYTKNDEMDLFIALKVKFKTGLDALQQKEKIAAYLASGKKLSVLKKQLIKQGALKPQADTLKKSGAAKTQAEKAADVEAKANAGYTPTSTPTTMKDTGAPTDTGKAPTKAHAKADAVLGDASALSDKVQLAVYEEFMSGFSGSSEAGEAIARRVFATLDDLEQFYPDLTALQILRVVDQRRADKLGIANDHTFEKKVLSFLTTPVGTTFARDRRIKKARATASAATQPPLPADSVQYEHWSLAKARQEGIAVQLEQGKWDARMQRDMKYYTAAGFIKMNGYLRGNLQDVDERTKNGIEGVRMAMRKSREPVLLRRGAGVAQFGLSSTEELWSLAGNTFEDKGFLSTSINREGSFVGDFAMEIECPIGTSMAFVAPVSEHTHENEMLLDAGTRYKVLNVRKDDGRFVVRLRVV